MTKFLSFLNGNRIDRVFINLWQYDIYISIHITIISKDGVKCILRIYFNNVASCVAIVNARHKDKRYYEVAIMGHYFYTDAEFHSNVLIHFTGRII